MTPPAEAAPQPVASRAVKSWLLLIALSWGFNWPAVKLALNEMPIWCMRAVGLSFGAALLLIMVAAAGRSLRVAPRDWWPLTIAALLNVSGFNILTAVAQTLMPTSRAVILAYTMPLWTALLARIFLGERLNAQRRWALALGAAGLAAVLVPLGPSLAQPGVQAGILAILGAAISWAGGTVYIKRVPIPADPIASTGWQLAIGAVTALAGAWVFESAHLAAGSFWPATVFGWGGLAYNSVIGIALSYILWFGIVARLPASTAAIGVLLVPVVGVTSAMAIIGEQPTLFDGIGFVFIIAAVILNLRASN